MSTTTPGENRGLMRRTVARPVYAGTVLVLMAILFLALNTFANVGLRGARLDLTEKSLYTLSDGTRSIVSKLREPITLQFYYSEELATEFSDIRAYGQRVRDMLQEIASLSDGKILVEEVEPEAFSEEEDVAEALGLTPVPLRTGDRIFFGLVGTNTVDGREVIPFFAPERATYLEYDLARLIFSLSHPDKPKLGVVTNLPLDTGAGGLLLAMEGKSQPFMIYQELQRSFQIEFMEQDFDRVPNEIKVLALIHPKDLDPQTLYAVDQFVMRGGRVLAFFDPYSEVSLTAGAAGKPVQGYTESSNLETLMDSWGVKLDMQHVLGDRLRAQRVSAGMRQRRQLVDYVLWQRFVPEDFAADDPITASIDALHVGSTGTLEPIEGASTTFTPLVTSSDDAMLITVERMKEAPAPDDLLKAFKPADHKFTVAARISGPVTSAFPNGRPEETAEEGEDAEAADTPPASSPTGEHMASTVEDANIVVFADSDIFDDRFWVQIQSFMGDRVAVPTADNANFVVSAVENLMGSNDLISLRAREPADRPFTVVEDIRREAEAKYLAEEERLEAKISDAEKRLADLQAELPDGGNASALMTDAQEKEMQALRQELSEGRKALRDVQRDLRRDVDALGARLRFINMALVPILVAGVAVGLAWVRRNRRKRRAEAAGRAGTVTKGGAA